MEYNFDPKKEYTPLPDEYLQNGGRPEHNNPKKKSKLKKMLYMFMAYVVIIMAVNASDIPSRIDAAVTPPETLMLCLILTQLRLAQIIQVLTAQPPPLMTHLQQVHLPIH